MQSVNNSAAKNFSVTRIAALLLLMVCASFTIQGQTNFGRISGTVKDSNGAAIPNATVTITNAANNSVRTVTSDSDGFYTATNLPVGTYTVAAVGNGFKKAEQSGIALAADSRLTLDLVLEPGQVTETVQVTTAVGETVNTTSGEVARVVDQ